MRRVTGDLRGEAAWPGLLGEPGRPRGTGGPLFITRSSLKTDGEGLLPTKSECGSKEGGRGKRNGKRKEGREKDTGDPNRPDRNRMESHGAARTQPRRSVTPEAAAGDAHGHPSRLHGVVVVVVVGLK